MNLLLTKNLRKRDGKSNKSREKPGALEGQITSSLEPGRDAKPLCPSTDPPSISDQGMDFQKRLSA